jgi:hypothetical protein
MEKELLEMAEQWKKTALEELEKCKPASRAEFANQMLLVCAEMLEWKLKNLGACEAHHLPSQCSPDNSPSQMRSVLVAVAVLISGCGDTHFAPKVITANGGKLVAIACSGAITVGGSQQGGYEVDFTDEKGRGLRDVQIDDEPELTKVCSGQTTNASQEGQSKPAEERQLSSEEIEDLRK